MQTRKIHENNVWVVYLVCEGYDMYIAAFESATTAGVFISKLGVQSGMVSMPKDSVLCRHLKVNNYGS